MNIIAVSHIFELISLSDGNEDFMSFDRSSKTTLPILTEVPNIPVLPNNKLFPLLKDDFLNIELLGPSHVHQHLLQKGVTLHLEKGVESFENSTNKIHRHIVLKR